MPCFADVLTIVESLAPKGSTYGWVDAVRGVQHKLWRLRDRYPIAFATRACNLDVLFKRSLYVPLLFQSTSDEFVFATLAHFLFLHHYSGGIRDLTTLVLYDEGLTAWSSKPANIDQAPVLASLQVQLREMGIGMIVTSAAISMTNALLKSNVHIRVTMGAGNPLDVDELTRTFQFTPGQREYLLTRIVPGQAIVKIGTDVPRLVAFPNSINDKRVAPTEWQEALARTDILRTPEPILRFAAPATKDSEKPEQSQTPATPVNPPSRNAPIARETSDNGDDEEISPNALVEGVGISLNEKKTSPNGVRQRVALSKHCVLMMDDVGEHHLTLTTPCFLRCGLRLSEGERAKTTLTNLGFIESFKVRTGAGRGRVGQAMRLSSSGRVWLGKAGAKSTKGGDSVQHEFFVQHLSRLIPHSSIETLGVDLIIPFHAEQHAQFKLALETLSASVIALNTGDLIALEVETAAPKVTGPRNVTKDVGFALTVIATYAKDMPSVQHRISHNSEVKVINVLRLIDALRPTEKA